MKFGKNSLSVFIWHLEFFVKKIIQVIFFFRVEVLESYLSLLPFPFFSIFIKNPQFQPPAMYRTAVLLLVLLSTSTVLSFVAPPSQATLACITCIATVKGLEPRVLAEGDDVAKHEVEALCLKEAPTPAAEKSCEEYGDDEIEVIISLIKQDVPPKTICQQLKKC
ncbi:CRE-SPP-23 protein [Caenorhabditis remanei]|uniref:CRE-SPP-23 protein n=1 Tax=Caenorhabditis remanei TaxID=31234 RepID=E3LY03_CAERE|nr:CRE-SPP-23 protein [Caenorhabditis remanei]